jgi:hypothetical protein
LEIRTLLYHENTALLVNPSKYIASDEDLKSYEAMKKMINDVSAMYKISINKKILEGNPVKSITTSLPDYNLLIADAQGFKYRGFVSSFLNPDVFWGIIRNSVTSTLLLPLVEELL